MNPVIIGGATLYLGDCLEILPTLPKVEAVIGRMAEAIRLSWASEAEAVNMAKALEQLRAERTI